MCNVHNAFHSLLHRNCQENQSEIKGVFFENHWKIVQKVTIFQGISQDTSEKMFIKSVQILIQFKSIYLSTTGVISTDSINPIP